MLVFLQPTLPKLMQHFNSDFWSLKSSGYFNFTSVNGLTLQQQQQPAGSWEFKSFIPGAAVGFVGMLLDPCSGQAQATRRSHGATNPAVPSSKGQAGKGTALPGILGTIRVQRRNELHGNPCSRLREPLKHPT